LRQQSHGDSSTQEPNSESSSVANFSARNLHCSSPLADEPLTDHHSPYNSRASPTLSITSTFSGQGWVSPGLVTPPGKRRRRDSLSSTSASPLGWIDPGLKSPSPVSHVRWASLDEGWIDPGLESPPGRSKRKDPSYFAEMVGEQNSETTDAETSGQASAFFVSDGKPIIKIPADTAWVKGRLHQYGLHQEDVSAFAKYPDFEKQARDILKRKRDSEISPKEQESFTVAHRKFKDFNEDTLLCQLMPYLVNRDRKVPQNLVKRADIVDGEEAQVSVDFVASGLMTIANREFSRSLPWIFDKDKDLDKAMKKDAHMTNPKPDRTFAVDVEKLPWPANFVIPARIVALTDVVRSCCHPFCLWEAKSDQGTLADSRNQACRGCATIQYYERYLRAELGQKDVTGPDTRTFVFSIVSSPEIIEIHVHWVEVPNDKSQAPIYHMNRLSTKALADDEGLGPIRKLINNILDWGIGSRFDGMAGLHQEINAYARKIAEKNHEAAAAKAKESPNKKQKVG
ncbi:MAG: hypothetical protein Q9210_007258, partial [Variospora velana]